MTNPLLAALHTTDRARPALGRLAAGLLLTVAFGAGAAEAPTRAIVERVMKSTWEKAPSSTGPKITLTLNEVKFGKPYRATVQEVQVEGIPAQGTVTPAIVDFTVRSHDPRETRALRRVREARVYKDKMDEWAVMTGSVRGQDVATVEPATPR